VIGRTRHGPPGQRPIVQHDPQRILIVTHQMADIGLQHRINFADIQQIDIVERSAKRTMHHGATAALTA